MADTAFKQQCIALRNQDYSISEIMKATGRSKTTVYHHIQNMPLSAEKRLRLRRFAASQIAGMSSKWKDKSRLDRHPVPFTEWTPELVMLVAHLMFDGELKRASCVYNNRSEALRTRFENLMKLVYAFPSKEYIGTYGVIRLSYANIELAQLMGIKAKELRKAILAMPLEFQLKFLHAFFDDEGCVSYNITKHRRQVRGYQHDTEMLYIIQRLLSNFRITSTVNERFNEVYIKGKKDLQLFADKINFAPGLCVNGKRSNSVWKESLEKREILRRALASYQH